MALLKLLNAVVAVTSDRQATPGSYGYQTGELLAFFRQVRDAIEKAYSNPGAPVAMAATGSPMAITAADRQALHVSGGTVSGITLARAGATLGIAYSTIGTLIPMAPGDVATITYTAAPTIRTLAQ